MPQVPSPFESPGRISQFNSFVKTTDVVRCKVQTKYTSGHKTAAVYFRSAKWIWTEGMNPMQGLDCHWRSSCSLPVNEDRKCGKVRQGGSIISSVRPFVVLKLALLRDFWHLVFYEGETGWQVPICNWPIQIGQTHTHTHNPEGMLGAANLRPPSGCTMYRILLLLVSLVRGLPGRDQIFHGLEFRIFFRRWCRAST